MRATIKAFLHDDTGATAVEYGLIVLLIATAIFATVATMGTHVVALFNNGTAEVLAAQAAKIK